MNPKLSIVRAGGTRRVVGPLWAPSRALALTALMFGCGTMPVEGELVTPDAPARIVREMINGEPGLVMRIVVDSATGDFTVSCTSSVVRCPPHWFSEGVASRAQVHLLFASTRSSEFRALRKEYDLSGTFVDGPLFVLTVTASGRTREIRWSTSPVPRVLTQLDDQVLQMANLSAPVR